MSSLHAGATPITSSQRKTLEAIAEYVHEHGYAPSLEELTETLGLASTNAVRDQLKYLRAKGYVSWEPKRARTLQIVETGTAA